MSISPLYQHETFAIRQPQQASCTVPVPGRFKVVSDSAAGFGLRPPAMLARPQAIDIACYKRSTNLVRLTWFPGRLYCRPLQYAASPNLPYWKAIYAVAMCQVLRSLPDPVTRTSVEFLQTLFPALQVDALSCSCIVCTPSDQIWPPPN